MDMWITHQLHFVFSSFNPVSPSVKHKIKIKETGRFHFAKINTVKKRQIEPCESTAREVSLNGHTIAFPPQTQS